MRRLADILRRAAGRRRRGYIAIEAILILPTLLVVFSGVVQVLILAQGRVYLEQAAYAAARSALVHKCKPFNLIDLYQSPIGALRSGSCTDRPQKWEDAARWALVAAAPSSEFATARGACPNLPVVGDMLDGTSLTAGNLQQAFEHRVCYAYEPENVTVEVEWVQDAGDILGVTPTPIRATVTYRMPLTTPFRRFLSDGQRGDGTYWREATATVVLL